MLAARIPSSHAIPNAFVPKSSIHLREIVPTVSVTIVPLPFLRAQARHSLRLRVRDWERRGVRHVEPGGGGVARRSRLRHQLRRAPAAYQLDGGGCLPRCLTPALPRSPAPSLPRSLLPSSGSLPPILSCVNLLPSPSAGTLSCCVSVLQPVSCGVWKRARGDRTLRLRCTVERNEGRLSTQTGWRRPQAGTQQRV